MYGPPPDCKRFEVGRRDSLRKCIRPLSGESLSGHLMMIRTCRSFKIPRSPGTRLSVQVFRHAVGLFFRLLLSSADLGGTFSKLRRRGGGKVESVLCFPSVASFPRPSSGHLLQRLMSILFAAGQHGPGHASQLVGDRHHDLITWSTLRHRCTHCPNPPVSYLTRSSTARAPWISMRRR